MRHALLVVLLVCCSVVEASWWDIGKYVYPPCWIKTEETYGPYGTFNDRSPYDNALCKIPEPPAEMGLQLYLYTRANPNTPRYISNLYPSLDNSNFDIHKNTKFIVHGFTDNCFSDWVEEMTNELLNYEDVNVFRVNWNKGASKKYSQSAANTRLVAAMLARFINFLKSKGAPYESIHMIGHSLGAHICGQTGQRTGQKIGRITGMDPAGPYFDRESHEIRLDSTDALFVDCIHSDAEHMLQFGLGMERRMGNVDFYPQGGHDQDKCPKTVWATLTSLLDSFKSMRDGIACSHSRAHKYFTQSIVKCKYQANDCADYKAFLQNGCWCKGCNQMGYHANKNLQGKFYLDVSGTAPYCCKYLRPGFVL